MAILGFVLPGSGKGKLGLCAQGSGGFAAAAAIVIVICAAGPSSGQVLAVGPDGAVSVYDGPEVFTDKGALPIVSTAPVATSRMRAPNREALARAAKDADLSPELLAAVAWRESGFRTDRVSRAGAVGEMQLMPATARELGVDPTNPEQNLRGGATYLRNMLIRYHGDLPTALAAYNAGPGAVDRHRGAAPPFKETQDYVGAILGRLSDVALRGAPGTAALARKGGE